LNRSLYIVLIFFACLKAIACQCPSTILNRQECNRYDVIFRGTVREVKPCEGKTGAAIFSIEELYQGNTGKEFKVIFECDEPCSQNFNPGEEWIIYADYRHLNDAKLDWCSRSRKYFKIENQDFYKVIYGNDYEEELKFLRDSLGVHRLLKDSTGSTSERNIKPEKWQLVVLLLVSLAGMVLFYWLFRKYFKF
jgi:hypothetical protein